MSPIDEVLRGLAQSLLPVDGEQGEEGVASVAASADKRRILLGQLCDTLILAASAHNEHAIRTLLCYHPLAAVWLFPWRPRRDQGLLSSLGGPVADASEELAE